MKGTSTRRNPSRGGSTGDGCRCRNVRFEERAREFILLARLTEKGSRRETNKSVAQAWDDVLKVRGVSRIRPEAERSMRGQVEA